MPLIKITIVNVCLAGADEDVHAEGMLNRKHEWETHSKRASNRSWDKVYIVLEGGNVSSFKDQKHAKSVSVRFCHKISSEMCFI